MISTSSSVRSLSPIELRTSCSGLTSSVDALFMDLWIKIGLERSMKSSALAARSLSNLIYRWEYPGKILKLNTLDKMSCTCVLWRRQHYFRTIRTFALTRGILLFGLVDLVHFPSVKFAGDVGGSTGASTPRTRIPFRTIIDVFRWFSQRCRISNHFHPCLRNLYWN